MRVTCQNRYDRASEPDAKNRKGKVTVHKLGTLEIESARVTTLQINPSICVPHAPWKRGHRCVMASNPSPVGVHLGLLRLSMKAGQSVGKRKAMLSPSRETAPDANHRSSLSNPYLSSRVEHGLGGGSRGMAHILPRVSAMSTKPLQRSKPLKEQERVRHKQGMGFKRYDQEY